MTDEQLKKELEKISKLTHYEMAYLHRFAPAGHKYFVTGTPLQQAFEKRYLEFGGMTPEISKRLG